MATPMDVDPGIVRTKYKLNNGVEMPAVGFGTFRIKNSSVLIKAIDAALDAGYRMFDTAAVYHNESLLGEAFKTLLPKYGLEREDIFITTKLSPSDHGDCDAVKRAYEASIKKLGIDFADLYLIHFPGTAKLSHEDKMNVEFRNQTWAGLLELYDEGLVNAIGVSNFTVTHLQQLIQSNHSTIPAVNQVEWHPFYQQPELLDFCRANEIVLQAYCSLGGTSANNDALLQHPAVTQIARKLEVSNAQVLLAWAVQQEIAIIPKAVRVEHIRENMALNFVIPEEDMRILTDLKSYQVKYAWDPSNVA